MVETSDFRDTLGAGNYPEPPEEKMQTISGKIVITYDIEADVPRKWDKENIIADIKENLDDYVYALDFKNMDIDLDYWSEDDV